ncbi:hypothetical protein GCM10023339_68750 [Alloalcanivorax gelatiniphagus]
MVGYLCRSDWAALRFSRDELAPTALLRNNKPDALESGQPDAIATANIGCQMHLGAAGRGPVRHWVEVVDRGLSERLDRD